MTERCANTSTSGVNPGPCGPMPCTGECYEPVPPARWPDLLEGYGDADPWEDPWVVSS